MEHAFTWVSVIPGLSALPGHAATSLLVTGALILFAYLANRQLATASDAGVTSPWLREKPVVAALANATRSLPGFESPITGDAPIGTRGTVGRPARSM